MEMSKNTITRTVTSAHTTLLLIDGVGTMSLNDSKLPVRLHVNTDILIMMTMYNYTDVAY